MKPKWTTAILCLSLPLCALAEQFHGLPELPQKRISLTILDSMPATNLLQFVTHRSGLRLDLADEIKTNAVSFRFRFDNAESTQVVGWALRFLNAHATVNRDILHVAAGSPPALPDGKPATTSQLLAQPFSRTNSWTHRVDQTIEYVLHIAGHKNFVMGPDGPLFRTKVTLEPNGRSSAEILEDLCHQARLECTLHGKLLFIRKRKDKELPNGIGTPITERPSHPTERTDRVLGE